MLEQALQSEKEALEKERGLLADRVSAATARLAVIEERLSLVVALMNHTGEVAGQAGADGQNHKTSAVEAAFQVLSERDGVTMHYKELADEVKARGGDISGVNAAQILVARLVKDERFVRPLRKGFYGLRKDYPGAQNVGERKKRAAARRRAIRKRAEPKVAS